MEDLEQRRDKTQEAESSYSIITNCSNKMLVKILETECPHTAALIISRLPLEKKAAVLEHLLQRLSDNGQNNGQKKLLMELALGTSELAESIELIEADIATQIRRFTAKGYRQIGGSDFVSKAIEGMKKSARDAVLTLLKNSNAALYERVKADMFSFQDLAWLDDRSIQKMLREIDIEKLAKALVIAPTDIKNKILQNMSKRAASMLEDEMEIMEGLEPQVVEEAQGHLVNIVLLLAEMGEFIIPDVKERRGSSKGQTEEKGVYSEQESQSDYIDRLNTGTPFDFITNCDRAELRELLEQNCDTAVLEQTFDTATLCAVLEQENPLIISRVIGSLPLYKASDLLQRLPDSVLLPVIDDLVRGNWESADVLERIAADIRNKIEPHAEVPYIDFGGIDFLEKVIGNTDKRFTEKMLTFLAEIDHEAYTAIRERIFFFEDIVQLDDRSIQKLLPKIATFELAQALKTASPALQEKIERNMSKRVAARLREEMAFMGPRSIRSVRVERQKILERLRHFIENGDIVLPQTASKKTIDIEGINIGHL